MKYVSEKEYLYKNYFSYKYLISTHFTRMFNEFVINCIIYRTILVEFNTFDFNIINFLLEYTFFLSE